MPSITKADVSMLGRRAQQPRKAPGELLALFVRGKLVNTKNARLHWKSESRYKRQWRERVAEVLLETGWRNPGPEQAAIPKCVLLICNVYGLMDEHDGLRVACAPVVDALQAAGVLHSDAPESGHVFGYAQRRDRANRGIEIRVTPRRRAPHEKSVAPGLARGD
jgi:hypothetical protein